MKKATKKTAKRVRRTHEQMIAALQAEIERVKSRAATKEAKSDPASKALISAAKAIDKALAVAQEHKSAEVAKALEAARAPLSEALVEMGVRMPAGNKRGPRKQTAA